MSPQFGGHWEHALNNRLSLPTRRGLAGITAASDDWPSLLPGKTDRFPLALFGARIRREYRCALSVHRFGAAVQEASRCASYVLLLSRPVSSLVIPL
jgi:hypothetical protein